MKKIIARWLGIQKEITRMEETIHYMDRRIKTTMQQQDMLTEKIRQLTKTVQQCK